MKAAQGIIGCVLGLFAANAKAQPADVALDAIQKVLAGQSITSVMATVDASGETLDDATKNAIWDFYKAKSGQAFKNGAWTPITGSERRQWLKTGGGRIAPILGTRVGTTVHTQIEEASESLFNTTLQQDGITSGHAFLVMDASFNVIYDFLADHNAEVDARLRNMKTVLRKFPAQHRAKAYPIFIVKARPGGVANSGGTFPVYKKEDGNSVAGWESVGAQANTGVKWTDLTRLINISSDGIIALTKEAVSKADDRLGTVNDGWAYTLGHELGHSVDQTLRMPQRTALPGQAFKGIHAVADAYGRYFLKPRNQMCREKYMPEGFTDADFAKCHQDWNSFFRATPAFTAFNIP